MGGVIYCRKWFLPQTVYSWACGVSSQFSGIRVSSRKPTCSWCTQPSLRFCKFHISDFSWRFYLHVAVLRCVRELNEKSFFKSEKVGKCVPSGKSLEEKQRWTEKEPRKQTATVWTLLSGNRLRKYENHAEIIYASLFFIYLNASLILADEDFLQKTTALEFSRFEFLSTKTLHQFRVDHVQERCTFLKFYVCRKCWDFYRISSEPSKKRNCFRFFFLFRVVWSHAVNSKCTETACLRDAVLLVVKWEETRFADFNWIFDVEGTVGDEIRSISLSANIT